MSRYLIRRLLAMIPTVLGVLLITFLLFNVVGGSPAGMALGKNATPESLEEFDEARGFNKPVIAGWWAPTRALAGTDFAHGPGPWQQVAGAKAGQGALRLAAGGRYALPLAFPLRPDTEYRLRVEARAGGGGATLQLFPASAGSGVGSIPVTARWHTRSLTFRTRDRAPVPTPLLEVAGGELEISSVRLERRMAHPFDSQLTHFFRQLARLDLGVSLATHEPVTTMLRRGVGPSLALTVPIFTGELVLSVILALSCAYWRDRWPDRTLVVMAVGLMSVNYLVWIVLGQFVLAYRLNWFPIWGFASWRCLLLPVAIGILSGLGANVRFYRTVMLDELYKDYVRTAFAKGLGPVRVLFRHVLPNAMIPIVTQTVIALPFLYTGSLLLESFFGIPGLGGLSINAINSSDVDVVRGVVLVGAVLYVVANLVADLAYAVVDPRVRLK
jgi:peptide/nickel transport system permease protein